MKEKILNVKNILKIILILFILFNMAKSCSYAWTFEEFYEFVDENYSNATNEVKTNITFLRNNKTAILEKISEKGYDIDDFNAFAIVGNPSTTILIHCYQMEENSEYKISSSSIYYWKKTKWFGITRANGNINIGNLTTQTSDNWREFCK